MVATRAALLLALALAVGARSVRQADEPMQPRPDHNDYARTARWLVHWNSWGTLATNSRSYEGFPYSSVVSYADGPTNNSTGRLIFYLTEMDAAAADAEADHKVALSLAQSQLPGGCGLTDPEDPTCARVTLLGQLQRMGNDSVPEAEGLLWQRHPAMRTWPADHQFHFYELTVEHVLLLDWYGGLHNVPAEEYFAVDLLPNHVDPCQEHSYRVYCILERFYQAEEAAKNRLREQQE